MRKAIFAICVLAATMTSCGSASTQNDSKSDSTAVTKADTLSGTKVDTAVGTSDSSAAVK